MDKRHVAIVCIAIMYVMIATAMYSFMGVELTDDVKVFIGAGKQALTISPHGGFMTNVDEAWELKPLGNRLLYYSIVLVTTALEVPTDIWLKIAALSSLAIAAFALSIETTRRLPEHAPIDVDIVFAVVILSMLTLANLFFMQAEWWAVLFSFAVLWMLLSRSPALMGFAGLLSIGIISLKLSTLLLIPSIFAAYVLLEGGNAYRKMAISYGVGFSAGLLCAMGWLIYLPHAIQDMILSVQLAHAAKGVDISTFEGMNYLIFYVFDNIPNAPAVWLGIIALLIVIVFVLVIWIRQGAPVSECSIRTVSVLTVLWGFPLVSILIQKEFFSYHYMVLIFPAVITLVLLIGNIRAPTKVIFATSAISIVFLIWLVMNSLWSPLYAQQDAFWKGTVNDSKNFQERYDLTGEILYLDIPSATYYLNATSACRMIGSLPIERKLTWTAEYTENLACVQKYQGRYMVSKHGSGMPSLLPNYTKIEEGTSWDLYVRN